MPLYEYECNQCHQRLEKIQSFSAPPEKVCPKCGGELKRVISAPALQFKGAGWYVNDYAKSGGRAAPPPSDGNTGTKSDGSSGASDGSKSGSDTSNSKAADTSPSPGTASESGSSSKSDSSKPAS